MSAPGYSSQYGRCTCGHGYGCTCITIDDRYIFSYSDYNSQLPNNNLTLSVSTGLTFAELPSVTFEIGPIERRFPSIRPFLSPSSFEATKTWLEILDATTTYFVENSIAYRLPDDEAIFYVKGVPADTTLNFNIYCCIKDNNTFIVEFRRVGQGNIEILSNIFVGIRNLLVENAEELDE